MSKIPGKLEHQPNCPFCGLKLDGYTCATPGSDIHTEPKVGDITVCVGCRGVLQFSLGMALIPAPESVLDQMNLHDLSRAQGMAQLYRRFKAAREKEKNNE